MLLGIVCIEVGRAGEPIQIVSFRVDPESQVASMEWTGGQPPYRVQASTDPALGWFDISEYLLTNSYATPYGPEFTLFRVRLASDDSPPVSPTGLAVAARNCDMLAILWERAQDNPEGSGIAGYRVYRDGVKLVEVTSPERFFLDKNAQHDRSFVYEVTAVDLVGNESTASEPLIVESILCVAENGPAPVMLSWESGTDGQIAGHLVYWGEKPGDYKWARDAMDYEVVVIPNLKPEATYFFAVTSYDWNDVQSDFSREVAFITSSSAVR
jgi:hypothetical protein